MNVIKNKSPSLQKTLMKENERQAKDIEKIFSIHNLTSFIFRIYKEILKYSKKETTCFLYAQRT